METVMSKKPATVVAAPVIPERKVGVSKEQMLLMAGINKKLGVGTISAGNQAAIQNIEAIPTHIACLEAAIGIPGIPRGRIIEVMGLESCGKTTTVLHMAVVNGHGSQRRSVMVL
jgi:RecA/RadA recombinase